MRIEIVCPSRELFGSDRSAVRLGVLLRTLGHEVSLTLPRQRPGLGLDELAADAAIPARTDAVVVGSTRGLSGLRPTPRRGMHHADLTIYNSTAVVACRGDKAPRALVVREWLMPGWARHRVLAAWHRRRIDVAIGVSEGVARQWRATAGGKVPVTVCHNWLDEPWFEFQPSADRSGLLFAGRLSAWKGQLALADAFERAFPTGAPQPSLTFLGAERAPSVFQRHAEDLRRRAQPRGWRVLETTDDARPHFAAASLVVVPSLRPEPFGNVILEGLASGARVIAFPGGGADDVAPIFEGAMEVVSRDTDELARALRRWWDAGGAPQSPEEHQRTRAGLREHFSAEAAAPRWREIVSTLAG